MGGAMAQPAAVSERVLMGVPVTIQADRAGWAADPPAVIVTVRGPSHGVATLFLAKEAE